MFTPQFKITATHPTDRIWQAVKMYHNQFYPEKARCEALDILFNKFSSQLCEAWETYEMEHWVAEKELEEIRGTEREHTWEMNELLNRLNF